MAQSQTFHDHVNELRRRILWVVLAIGVSAGIAYALRMRLVMMLQRPLGAPLFYNSPAGSFNFILKLAMTIGMFVALPVAIYHILRFVEPALPVTIKKWFMVKVIGSSFLLALAGVSFAFFLMVPMSLKFFGGYSSAQIKPLISANEYLSFVTNHMVIFALVFQIPLIVLFINWIKPFSPRKLLKYQKHVIVGAFGIAIILPFTYDPLSQFIVAIPVVVLYYISVILLWIVNRGKKVAPKSVVKPKIEPQAPPPPAPALNPAPSLGSLIPAAPLRSLDGFNHTPTGARMLEPQARTSPHYTSKPTPKPVSRPANNGLRRPSLTIDGISPSLSPLRPQF